MWIKADLHIHSTYSDGKAGPREILLYSLYRDLGIIAVTDHNTFQGGLETYKLARNMDNAPLVLIGNEVRTDKGDILVYCFEPINTPHDVGELIDQAHSNDCLVVPAHPFDKWRSGIGENVYEYSGWDAIEVWNASATVSANREALRAAKLLGLPGLANSDAHILEYIGVAYTLINVDELSIENVFKAIRNNRVKPHYGRPPFKYFVKKVLWSIKRRI